MAELLVAEGKIDPGGWSKALGAELDRREARGEPDDEATYYAAVLATLERVLAAGEVAPKADVDRRSDDWRQAYLSTPHGQPVALDS